MDFFFSTVAGVMPCFGFTTSRVLITHQCFVIAEQCLHSVKAFSASPHHPSSEEVHRELGEDTAGTPQQMEGESSSTWHLAEQALLGGKKEEKGHLELWLRPCFLGNGQISACLGSRE